MLQCADLTYLKKSNCQIGLAMQEECELTYTLRQPAFYLETQKWNISDGR